MSQNVKVLHHLLADAIWLFIYIVCNDIQIFLFVAQVSKFGVKQNYQLLKGFKRNALSEWTYDKCCEEKYGDPARRLHYSAWLTLWMEAQWLGGWEEKGREISDKGIRKHMLIGISEWVANTKGLAAGSIAFSYRWSKNDYPAVKDKPHGTWHKHTHSLSIILKLKLNARTIIMFYQIMKI